MHWLALLTCWGPDEDGGGGWGWEWQGSGSHLDMKFHPPGILTGRCVNYSSVLRTCEIQGWCPTEVDTVEM